MGAQIQNLQWQPIQVLVHSQMCLLKHPWCQQMRNVDVHLIMPSLSFARLIIICYLMLLTVTERKHLISCHLVFRMIIGMVFKVGGSI